MPRRVAEIEGAATIDPRQQVVVLVEIGNVAHSPATRWSSLVTWLTVVRLDLAAAPGESDLLFVDHGLP
jgi:hypothetical protein